MTGEGWGLGLGARGLVCWGLGVSGAWLGPGLNTGACCWGSGAEAGAWGRGWGRGWGLGRGPGRRRLGREGRRNWGSCGIRN